MRIATMTRHFVMLGVLAIAVPASMGCKKKPADDESASADKGDDKGGKDDKKGGSKKKADDDGDGDSADASKYAHGDLLKHMPSTCKTGFVYLDLEALRKTAAFKDNIDKLQDKMTESVKGEDGEKAEKALKALKKAGIDPATDGRELAMCIGEDQKKDITVGIGGDFAGKDPIGAFGKAIEASGEDAPKKKTDGGIAYMVQKDKKGEPTIIAEVAPGVLVLQPGDSLDGLKKLKKAGDIADGYSVAKGRILSFDIFPPKGEGAKEAVVSLTAKGDNLELKISATGVDKGDAAKASDEKMKPMLDQVSKMLLGTPGAALADDVKTTKIKAEGDKVTITMTIADDHLAATIKKITDMSEDDVEKLVGGGMMGGHH